MQAVVCKLFSNGKIKTFPAVIEAVKYAKEKALEKFYLLTFEARGGNGVDIYVNGQYSEATLFCCEDNEKAWYCKEPYHTTDVYETPNKALKAFMKWYLTPDE